MPEINGDLSAVLANVDVLREAWEDVLSRESPEDFAESRQRSLRRHAIETGIIERLYDVDWGVTEALVAEGLTAEVAEREGGIDDDVLALIRSQFEALEFMAEAAREGTPLTVWFIRQRLVEAPPDQVQPQMERFRIRRGDRAGPRVQAGQLPQVSTDGPGRIIDVQQTSGHPLDRAPRQGHGISRPARLDHSRELKRDFSRAIGILPPPVIRVRPRVPPQPVNQPPDLCHLRVRHATIQPHRAPGSPRFRSAPWAPNDQRTLLPCAATASYGLPRRGWHERGRGNLGQGGRRSGE